MTSPNSDQGGWARATMWGSASCQSAAGPASRPARATLLSRSGSLRTSESRPRRRPAESPYGSVASCDDLQPKMCLCESCCVLAVRPGATGLARRRLSLAHLRGACDIWSMRSSTCVPLVARPGRLVKAPLWSPCVSSIPDVEPRGDYRTSAELAVLAHVRRVFSLDGKNASSRSSCAVMSIGVPIVETTEKNLKHRARELEAHVDDGHWRGHGPEIAEKSCDIRPRPQLLTSTRVSASRTPPTASRRARSRSGGTTASQLDTALRTGPGSIINRSTFEGSGSGAGASRSPNSRGGAGVRAQDVPGAVHDNPPGTVRAGRASSSTLPEPARARARRGAAE